MNENDSQATPIGTLNTLMIVIFLYIFIYRLCKFIEKASTPSPEEEQMKIIQQRFNDLSNDQKEDLLSLDLASKDAQGLICLKYICPLGGTLISQPGCLKVKVHKNFFTYEIFEKRRIENWITLEDMADASVVQDNNFRLRHNESLVYSSFGDASPITDRTIIRENTSLFDRGTAIFQPRNIIRAHRDYIERLSLKLEEILQLTNQRTDLTLRM